MLPHFIAGVTGLEGGETLILSDLMPAIAGTKLEATDDVEALASLKAAAAGETAVR